MIASATSLVLPLEEEFAPAARAPVLLGTHCCYFKAVQYAFDCQHKSRREYSKATPTRFQSTVTKNSIELVSSHALLRRMACRTIDRRQGRVFQLRRPDGFGSQTQTVPAERANVFLCRRKWKDGPKPPCLRVQGICNRLKGCRS